MNKLYYQICFLSNLIYKNIEYLLISAATCSLSCGRALSRFLRCARAGSQLSRFSRGTLNGLPESTPHEGNAHAFSRTRASRSEDLYRLEFTMRNFSHLYSYSYSDFFLINTPVILYKNSWFTLFYYKRLLK